MIINAKFSSNDKSYPWNRLMLLHNATSLTLYLFNLKDQSHSDQFIDIKHLEGVSGKSKPPKITEYSRSIISEKEDVDCIMARNESKCRIQN